LARAVSKTLSSIKSTKQRRVRMNAFLFKSLADAFARTEKHHSTIGGQQRFGNKIKKYKKEKKARKGNTKPSAVGWV